MGDRMTRAELACSRCLPDGLPPTDCATSTEPSKETANG